MGGRTSADGIYTETDGIVDWPFCVTKAPEDDVEILATRVGRLSNPQVYRQIADRLAAAQKRSTKAKPKTKGTMRTCG